MCNATLNKKQCTDNRAKERERERETENNFIFQFTEECKLLGSFIIIISIVILSLCIDAIACCCQRSPSYHFHHNFQYVCAFAAVIFCSLSFFVSLHEILWVKIGNVWAHFQCNWDRLLLSKDAAHFQIWQKILTKIHSNFCLFLIIYDCHVFPPYWIIWSSICSLVIEHSLSNQMVHAFLCK